VLEASRLLPHPSYHIWVVWEHKIPEQVARWLGETLRQKCGFTENEVEVFPKKVREDSPFGKGVKLPYGLHQEHKQWSVLVNPETFEPLPLEAIFEIQGASISDRDIRQIEEIISSKEDREPRYLDAPKKPYEGNSPPCIKRILEGVKKGKRDECAVILATHFINYKGYTPESALALLEDWNTKNEQPKGDEFTKAELEAKVRSAVLMSKSYGCEKTKELTGFCDPDHCFEPFSYIRKRYWKEGTFYASYLADEIMEKETFIALIDTKEIYVFKDGCYQSNGEALIDSYCKKALSEEYREARAKEVAANIRASTYVKRGNPPSNLIPLQNGVLNLETGEMEPHNIKYQFFGVFPILYDPKADCPEIKKFLSEITGREEDKLILEEMIGYCLFTDYRFQKALILLGEGANGKTTYLSLVKAFLGNENVSAYALQTIEEDGFTRADLFGKRANICADLPSKALYSTSFFKILTGGDPITAAQKFKAPFTFTNIAKMLFATNAIPETYDESNAFFRRWLIVHFPNTFTKERCDPKKIEKLATSEELSGLLNLALEARKRLIENGGFSYSKTTDEIREEYRRKSSPVAAFSMDIIEVDSQNWMSKTDLYDAYMKYCKGNDLPIRSKETFFKNFPRYAEYSEERRRIEAKEVRGVRGIRLKSAVEAAEPEGKTEISDLGSLQEKLEEIKNWLVANKDKDSLVDSQALAEKCGQLGLDVQKTVRILLDDYQIFEVPQMGKWGVK
jgi:putative DNA primase/helicase